MSLLLDWLSFDPPFFFSTKLDLRPGASVSYPGRFFVRRIRMEEIKKDRRRGKGFAGMSVERQREIASMGGKTVEASQRSFSRDPELARRAGSKGGRAVPAASRSFARNRALAAKAGSKGGAAVAAALRSFSRDPKLASEAGRKGGLNNINKKLWKKPDEAPKE